MELGLTTVNEVTNFGNTSLLQDLLLDVIDLGLYSVLDVGCNGVDLVVDLVLDESTNSSESIELAKSIVLEVDNLTDDTVDLAGDSVLDVVDLTLDVFVCLVDLAVLDSGDDLPNLAVDSANYGTDLA